MDQEKTNIELVLNLENAKQELVTAIQEINPEWQPVEDSTLYYMQVLLAILPDYPPKPLTAKPRLKKNNVGILLDSGTDTVPGDKPQETAGQREERVKLELLRRRLINIVDNEVYLNLPEEICARAFKIEFALAKIFPRNEKVLLNEEGQPVTEETWHDPISCENFTRQSKDIVVYTRIYSTTKAAALHWFQSDLAFDEHLHPRDMDHTPLSYREIISLLEQEIKFKQFITRLQPAAEIEPEVHFAVTFGRLMGSHIAFLASLFLWLLASQVCPPIIFPAVAMGFFATLVADRQQINGIYAFFLGMDIVLFNAGVFCFSYLAVTTSTLVLPLMSLTALSTVACTVVCTAVPTVTLAIASVAAWFTGENVISQFRLFGSHALLDILGNAGAAIVNLIACCFGVLPDMGVQPQIALGNSLDDQAEIPDPPPLPNNPGSYLHISRLMASPDSSPSPSPRPRPVNDSEAVPEEKTEAKLDIVMMDGSILEFHADTHGEQRSTRRP